MINILMLLAALALSAIAAYYSIAGLAAIFAAAVIPIVVMGSVLEVSKLVLASWLYRNWGDLPKLMKSYFLSAVVVLMCLTSMGIFGYLSKAHLDQAVPTGDVQAKVSLIDEKINQEKEIINESRKTLNQLDEQVNQTISRTSKDNSDAAVQRSVQIRRGQAKERASLFSTIESSQAKIAKLNEEKAPLSAQVRKIEAEVGPIKYIAALIYGDQIDSTLLEKAVRIVILMIVSVFDPLAVLMLVGYNWTLRRKEQVSGWHQEQVPNSETWPTYEVHAAGGDDLDPNESPRTAQEVLDEGRKIVATLKKKKPVKRKPKVKQEWDPIFDKALDKDIEKLFSGDDIIKTPAPPPPETAEQTIEEEVESLQKPVEYDSAGRRITP